MDRRTFLQSLAATGLGAPLSMPMSVHANSIDPDATIESTDNRHLILIELAGGNDGLNTVVPYRDPLYRQLRPDIALPEEQILQLDDSLGLHSALKPIMPLWDAGDLAIVNGVGYPDPNRSHFRSIEIWETASQSDETLRDGWLKPVTEQLDMRQSGVKAVALAEDQGPLAGSSSDTIVFSNLNQFIKQARILREQAAITQNASLRHILDVQKRTQNTALQFAESLQNSTPQQTRFPSNPLAKQLKTVAEIIASRTGPRVFKVGMGSFDTHQGQLNKHNSLLQQLATSIAAFKQSMDNAGLWNDVLVMTYSEFGRRAAQNGSAGTDHGTAAPQFVFGGRIQGGLHGAQPSLDQLENGDLVHKVDFRSLYRTIAEDWMRTTPNSDRYRSLEKLRLIA